MEGSVSFVSSEYFSLTELLIYVTYLVKASVRVWMVSKSIVKLFLDSKFLSWGLLSYETKCKIEL
jgi:hypothetical protein